MQNKQKLDNTNISIYQNWLKQNGLLVDVPGIEYFGNQTTFAEIDGCSFFSGVNLCLL